MNETSLVQKTTTTEALGALPPLAERQPPITSVAQDIPRWKLFVLTVFPAYAGSTAIGLALLALLPGWSFIAMNAVMTVLLVLLLTYGTQPLAMRLFDRWLHAPPKGAQPGQDASDEREEEHAAYEQELTVVLAQISERVKQRQAGGSDEGE